MLYRCLARAVICGLLALTAFMQPAVAQSYCDSLSGQTVGVGEGRWKLTSSGTTLYANAYHDNGSELTVESSIPIGWLSSGQTYTVGINTFLEDNTDTDADEGIVELLVYSKSGACSAGTYRGFARYKKNTAGLSGACSPSSECFFYGGRFVSLTASQSWGNIYYEVTADDTSSSLVSDSGCYNVGSSASVCL